MLTCCTSDKRLIANQGSNDKAPTNAIAEGEHLPKVEHGSKGSPKRFLSQAGLEDQPKANMR